MFIKKTETLIYLDDSTTPTELTQALQLLLFSENEMATMKTRELPQKKKPAKKKDPARKKTTGVKKASKKKAAVKKNKLGVKNSLVNNINARKEKGISRPKSKKTISRTSYKRMEENWD